MLENNEMNSCTPEQIFLPQKKIYKFRTTTYEVIAHFCSEEESLPDKVNHLLVSELQKQDAIPMIAHGHSGDV